MVRANNFNRNVEVVSVIEMSGIDNFESLSNAELRAKCKEYGLPNVPVTDSSRNVLIKKLRATISGSPALGNKKSSSRRETIAGSKVYPSIEEVKAATTITTKDVTASRSPSRGAGRRTIASASTPKTYSSVKESLSTTPVVTSTVVAPEIVPAQATTVSLGTKRRQENIQQNFIARREEHPSVLIHDENDEMLAAAAARAEELNTFKKNVQSTFDSYNRPRSSSRSSSLSKTGVLTTSYVQETVVLPKKAPILIESNEDEDFEEDEEEDMEVDVLDNDAGLTEVQNKPKHNESYTSDKPYTVGFSGLESKSSRVFTKHDVPFTVTDPVTKTSEPYTPYKPYTPTPPYNTYANTSTLRYVTNQNTAQSQPSYVGQSSARHSTSGALGSLRSMGPPASKRNTVGGVNYFPEQSDDTDSPNEEAPYDTPYLSNFTRNLERIKTESMGGGASDVKSRYQRKDISHVAPTCRPKLNDNDDVSLQKIFIALDRKYHIKRNFVILLLILLFIFLFVLFWQ